MIVILCSVVVVLVWQTLSNVMAILTSVQNGDQSPNKIKTRHFTALLRHLNDVANVQVRNAGSWAGNLMMAKGHPNFPSDLLTVLSGVGAGVFTESPSTAGWLAMGECCAVSVRVLCVCCACAVRVLCAVLCCAVLCCAVLCCFAVLCCAVLCCGVLCCAVLMPAL